MFCNLIFIIFVDFDEDDMCEKFNKSGISSDSIDDSSEKDYNYYKIAGKNYWECNDEIFLCGFDDEVGEQVGVIKDEKPLILYNKKIFGELKCVFDDENNLYWVLNEFKDDEGYNQDEDESRIAFFNGCDDGVSILMGHIFKGELDLINFQK